MDNLGKHIRSGIKTITFFSLFCLVLPFLVLTYFFVSISRRIWLGLLSNRYPSLEFATTNTVRSLVDTSRNPGVFHVLLQIKGEYDINVIKTKLKEHVLERKEKFGRDAFPKLKSTLISCWGHYAWIQKVGSDFDINNHVLLSSNKCRGRLITETNIQSCVSDIISKYMPPENPPWQIIVIPIADSDRYYILVRMHHLLLEEESKLKISDMLMLNNTKSMIGSSEKSTKLNSPTTPFLNLIKVPVFIPKLTSRSMVAVSNRWNEFIYRYDPLESADGDKKNINSIFQLLSVLLIITVTVGSDFFKGYNATKNTISIKWIFFKNLVQREVKRRNLTWNIVWKSICNSIDPFTLVKSIFFFIWWILISFIFMWPYILYREILAIRCCWFLGHIGYPNSLIGFIFEYTPLIYGAVKELISITGIIIRAPRIIYEELFETRKNDTHVLQTVSLCGRKVVSWSENLSKDELKDLVKKCGCNETELLLSSISTALQDFMISYNQDKKCENIEMIVRCILHEYLFGRLSSRKGVGGLSCINLPLESPSIQQTRKIDKIISVNRERQIAMYFLSQAQSNYDFLTNVIPAFLMKIIINYLSKKFTVVIIEVTEPDFESKKMTLWEHSIESAIYFRPPQSNTSLSITIQRFGSHIKLGVMADAQLSPNHTNITKNWTKYFEDFPNGLKTFN